jgi:hypothetical protein
MGFMRKNNGIIIARPPLQVVFEIKDHKGARRHRQQKGKGRYGYDSSHLPPKIKPGE